MIMLRPKEKETMLAKAMTVGQIEVLYKIVFAASVGNSFELYRIIHSDPCAKYFLGMLDAVDKWRDRAIELGMLDKDGKVKE